MRRHLRLCLSSSASVSPGAARQEGQSSARSMHLAELGSSAYPHLDNDGLIAFEYSDIARGENGVERFVVWVIRGIDNLDMQEPERAAAFRRARLAHHSACPRAKRLRCRISASFFETPHPQVESAHSSDLNGFYVALVRRDNEIHARKRGHVHEVASLYEYAEDDLETDPIF